MTQATLDEFEKLLEESFSNTHSVADIVEGTVLKKESDGYLISVRGAKTEAFLPVKEMSAAEEETPLEIGDEKEFYVLKEEHDDEGMLLSLKDLLMHKPGHSSTMQKFRATQFLQKSFLLLKAVFWLTLPTLKVSFRHPS